MTFSGTVKYVKVSGRSKEFLNNEITLQMFTGVSLQFETKPAYQIQKLLNK